MLVYFNLVNFLLKSIHVGDNVGKGEIFNILGVGINNERGFVQIAKCGSST